MSFPTIVSLSWLKSSSTNNKEDRAMSDKKTQKIEVSRKFQVGRLYDQEFFETLAEAQDAAQRETFSQGKEVLVYQAVEKAVPNTKEVKLEKLT